MSCKAHVGDKVMPDTILFDVDLEDLEKQLRDKELAIKKLQLQISDQEKNRALQNQKDELENIRAQEDYESTAAEEQVKDRMFRSPVGSGFTGTPSTFPRTSWNRPGR